jgi:hypothetical protein
LPCIWLLTRQRHLEEGTKFFCLIYCSNLLMSREWNSSFIAASSNFIHLKNCTETIFVFLFCFKLHLRFMFLSRRIFMFLKEVENAVCCNTEENTQRNYFVMCLRHQISGNIAKNLFSRWKFIKSVPKTSPLFLRN